jgi:hypothetical protein
MPNDKISIVKFQFFFEFFSKVNKTLVLKNSNCILIDSEFGIKRNELKLISLSYLSSDFFWNKVLLKLNKRTIYDIFLFKLCNINSI